MLSLRHFIIFKTVSETGNFTKAAAKLYITQSAVSHTIRELEEYTGTVLFDRLSKRVQLTANGKLLLEEVAPILAACESLDKRIGHMDQKAPLHIVSSITIASFWLPQVLQKLKEQLPDTPVNVTVVSAAEAVKILGAGEADVAFVEGAEPQGPFSCCHFAEDELKIVCAPEYFEGGLETEPGTPDMTKLTVRLNLSEFCNENLLLREVGSAIRDTLDSQLFLLGHTVHPRWVSVNSTALLKAAKAGLGIAVLPEELVREELAAGRLAEVRVEGLTLKNDFIAVWHKDKYMTPSLKILLESAVK